MSIENCVLWPGWMWDVVIAHGSHKQNVVAIAWPRVFEKVFDVAGKSGLKFTILWILIFSCVRITYKHPRRRSKNVDINFTDKHYSIINQKLIEKQLTVFYWSGTIQKYASLIIKIRPFRRSALPYPECWIECHLFWSCTCTDSMLDFCLWSHRPAKARMMG